MHFTGYVLQHGDPPHYLWGKNLQCTYFGLRHSMALPFKRSNFAKENVKFHAWVKKCHSVDISERAGMVVQPSNSNHSIWTILLVLDANEDLEILGGKTKKCLLFYVKIF